MGAWSPLLGMKANARLSKDGVETSSILLYLQGCHAYVRVIFLAREQGPQEVKNRVRLLTLEMKKARKKSQNLLVILFTEVVGVPPDLSP